MNTKRYVIRHDKDKVDFYYWSDIDCRPYYLNNQCLYDCNSYYNFKNCSFESAIRIVINHIRQNKINNSIITVYKNGKFNKTIQTSKYLK